MLDEIENLMSHFDEGTMTHKEIGMDVIQPDREALEQYDIDGRRHKSAVVEIGCIV